MVIYYYNFVEIIKLFILNGRVNGDEEGVFTCNQSSVVYYCIYIYISGANPGFQVRGGALKKIAPSRGRREHFRGISCEKSLFYAKKS